MFSLRSLVASGLLLSSTAAYAQWEVQSIPHKENPETTQLVARSPLSVPDETIELPYNDIQVSLGVTSFGGQCRPFFLFNKDPELGLNSFVYTEIDGKGHPLTISKMNGYGESSSYIWTYFVPGKEYGPRALAKAYTVESGFRFKEADHVYEFDMTGSKEAITQFVTSNFCRLAKRPEQVYKLPTTQSPFFPCLLSKSLLACLV